MYANVIVDITHEKLDKTFQYKVPERLSNAIFEGALVSVPFGKGDRNLQAFVLELTDVAEYDEDKIKEINDIVDTKVPVKTNAIKLASFIRKNYGGTMNQALKTVVPVKEEVTRKRKRIIKLKVSEDKVSEAIYDAGKKNAVARVRLLEALLNDNEIPYELVTGKLNIAPSAISKLSQMGIISVEDVDYYRNPLKNIERSVKDVTLNEEQSLIVDEINCDMDMGIRNTYLIHGITGSGKTEVYLEIISHVIDRGEDVIVLIPEIALTYQTVRRFYNRFGDMVSIINSKLSKGEKYDQMMRAKKGDVRIMIGPRSALFTPFSNLGLVIIDEEHEASYKSESHPRYHAREVAIELARLNNASVILGSATPSLEAYYKAKQGIYKLYTLSKRASQSTLPKVYICDMREELKQGNRSIFSGKMRKLIGEKLEKNEQVMLFLNRRGHSNFVSCRSCGEVIKCPHCDVSLKFHNNDTLMCHYCGYREPMKKTCPKCGSRYIGTFGIGTQRVEEEVHKIFPEAKTLRMDMDTTSKREDYDRILSTFAAHEADVLIGTQMIVKGHDFPLVTLVGIVAADLSLYADDYRAGERTFQLLTQAAGRAGRGCEPGEAVFQTYSPDNYSIVLSSAQDYEAFYEKEIQYRKRLNYPPVSNMLVIKIASANENECMEKSKLIAKHLNDGRMETTTIIGPINAHIYKMSDIFTNLVYIKDSEYERLTDYKDMVENYIKDNWDFKNVSVQFDFNPMNM